MTPFTGWPADATAFLAEIEADNTREFWALHRQRHAAAVHAPMRALAAELEPEFGPVRVLRAHRNRRFRPATPPYRTDTGGVARSAGGAALSVVLSATALSTAVGHWAFDRGQLRRYRAAVFGPAGEELSPLLAGHLVDRRRPLRGTPRGFRGDHPRIDLLRLRGLQVVTTSPVGEWLGTREPLERVRAAWRAAAPVVAWLDAHVGPADPVRPGQVTLPQGAGTATGLLQPDRLRPDDLVSRTESPPHNSTAQLPAGRTGEPPEYVQYARRLAGAPSGNLDPPIYAPDFRFGTLADSEDHRRPGA